MRKTLLIVLLALLSIGAIYGQYIVNFEGTGETKTAYASGNVTLSSISWNMTEALIGTETADFKNGLRSARLKGYGTSAMTMLADKANGIGTVSFQYRRYGTDGQVDWKVEYSTDSGANWTQIGAAFTAPASDVVQTFSESVNVSGNVRLRIKRATETGTTNKRLNIDDITLTDYAGAPTPTINVSGTLNAFSTYTGTPSASQSYTLSGNSLTGNINVAALAGYAYSTDDTNWNSTLSLANTYNGPVYVRLTGDTAGSFSGDIVHSSTGATSVNLAASGTVTDPTPTITLSSAALNPFSAIVGTPSAAQSYTVEGVFLTANISIAAVSGYEYSTSASGPYTSTLSLTPASGTVAPTTVWVRLTGTTLGEYTGNISHSSTGATTQDKAVTGAVTAAPTAELLFEENFEYAEAALLTDNGWAVTGNPATPVLTVSSPNLSYTGYIPNSGNSVALAVSGQDVNHTFTAQTTGSVYASALVNVTSSQTNGDYFLHFGQSTIGTTFRTRVFVKKDTDTTFKFGISFAGSSVVYTDTNYLVGTPQLLVMKYTFVSGASNDVAQLFVNPVISETEPTPTIQATDTNSDFTNVGTIAIRQGSASNSAVLRIDGIRVTNDWAELWSGEAPPTPVIVASTTELDPLACIVNNPSEETRNYTLYGENTTSTIIVTAPNGFQVATSETGEWSSVLNLPHTFNGTIYVRMFADGVGDYAGNITHTSGNATQVNVYISGESFNPDVTWNITQSLVPFSTQSGTPSSVQSYSLSAANAVTDLVVSTSAPFELSSNGSTGWTTELNLASGFNGSVFVRLNASSAGNFNANISHTSTNASPAEFAISGTATPAAGMAWDLFFSEYTEGLTGNNKVLEIFNGTGATVDLTGYSVKLGSNGAAWGNTLALTGTLANGATYVIANSGSIESILETANTTSTVTFFNGNDAVGLFNGSTLVDIIGVYMQSPNPAVGWDVAGVTTATANYTLIRKPSVVQGSTDFISGAGTTTENSEWIVMPWDDYSNLGMHTFGTVVSLDAPVVVITEDAGNVVLTWDAVSGAASYRIEASDDPYTGYDTVTTTTNLTWSGAASTAKKFYRVIALP